MRTVTDHLIPDTVGRTDKSNPNQLTITVVDDPGPGGANHLYRVDGCPTYDGPAAYTYVSFQRGPIQESGVNGITNEALLAIVMDRLRSFQTGPFRCHENAMAFGYVSDALTWLHRRTTWRIKRGVEGKNER